MNNQAEHPFLDLSHASAEAKAIIMLIERMAKLEQDYDAMKKELDNIRNPPSPQCHPTIASQIERYHAAAVNLQNHQIESCRQELGKIRPLWPQFISGEGVVAALELAKMAQHAELVFLRELYLLHLALSILRNVSSDVSDEFVVDILATMESCLAKATIQY